MSEDWQAKAVPQSVEVKPPEITSPPAEASRQEPARGQGEERKKIQIDSRRKGAEPSRPYRVAVLSLHGMGQQIPFETLDQVQRNFCAAAERAGVKLPKPGVQVTKLGGEVLRRAEVRMGEKPDAPEVHFYESYWAPLTEGRVGLRDVISFLRTGGWNGLEHCVRPSSRRYMFGKEFSLPHSVANAFYLALALLAVSALVAINGIVLAVAAATNWLGGSSGWLTPLLLEDLTGVASAVCLVGAVLVSGLFLSTMRRDLEGRLWRLPADRRFFLDSLFYLTLITLVGVAGTFALLVKVHSSIRPTESLLFLMAGSPERALQLATILTSATVLSLLILVAAGLVKAVLGKRLPSVARLAVVLGFYLVVACLAGAGGFMIAMFLADGAEFFSVSGLFGPLHWLLVNRNLWVWSVLIGLSAFARSFLVQYLGDVAAYVSPHKLDRFNEIRDQIKREVLKTARAVYSHAADGMPEYDRIAVVGHSLGSVVAYDTLNCLINEDLLSGPASDAAERTCLLLTFGSPLDKIAYLFQIQGTRTSDTREALANAVQPLIGSYDHRTFDWVNVFSNDDIICGSLELFDDGSGHPRTVQNEEDRNASIPLVAHTEYWRTPLVWDRLYRTVSTVLKEAAQPNIRQPPMTEHQREAG